MHLKMDPCAPTSAGLGYQSRGCRRCKSVHIHEAHITEQDVCQTEHNYISAVTIFSLCPHFHAVLKTMQSVFICDTEYFICSGILLSKRLSPFISIIIIKNKIKLFLRMSLKSPGILERCQGAS